MCPAITAETSRHIPVLLLLAMGEHNGYIRIAGYLLLYIFKNRNRVFLCFVAGFLIVNLIGGKAYNGYPQPVYILDDIRLHAVQILPVLFNIGTQRGQPVFSGKPFICLSQACAVFSVHLNSLFPSTIASYFIPASIHASGTPPPFPDGAAVGKISAVQQQHIFAVMPCLLDY